MRRIPRTGFVAVIAWLCLTASGAFAATTNVLVWSKDTDRVTADVRDWQLLSLLEAIAGQTGWHVFMEPDYSFKSSVKFKDLPSGQALRLLLGDLNFALVPQTNATQRLYVFRTAMKNATQQVLSATGRKEAKAKRVPNELIVRVKPGTDIEALAKSLGAKIVGSIPELNAYRLQFEDEEATDVARKKLLASSEVTGIEDNYYVDRPFMPQSLSGMSAPQTKLSLSPVSRDTGKVLIGLVDTTLQKQDPALEQFVKERLSLAGESSGDGMSPNHADAMLGASVQSLAQVLDKLDTTVQFISVDVFGKNAAADMFTGAQGMYEAYRHGATIINDSWGSYGDSPIVSDVVKFLIGQNVRVFAAVGNDSSTTPFSPASIPGVMAVTATEQGKIAGYSNVGTPPDVAAPGTVVFYFNGLVYGSRGTSVSSARASGVAAGVADATGATWSQVMSTVQRLLAVPKAK